ncbi:hypothetical protein COOONC_01139 [Cooperia oncophora]
MKTPSSEGKQISDAVRQASARRSSPGEGQKRYPTATHLEKKRIQESPTNSVELEQQNLQNAKEQVCNIIKGKDYESSGEKVNALDKKERLSNERIMKTTPVRSNEDKQKILLRRRAGNDDERLKSLEVSA